MKRGGKCNKKGATKEGKTRQKKGREYRKESSYDDTEDSDKGFLYNWTNEKSRSAERMDERGAMTARRSERRDGRADREIENENSPDCPSISCSVI